MLIFISLMILAHWIMGRDVSRNLDRFRKLDWKRNLNDIWARIRPYANKMGRTANRPILQFYYVLNDRNTSALDRALISGALIYVLLPVDVFPRAVYRIIGVIDDGVCSKVNSPHFQGEWWGNFQLLSTPMDCCLQALADKLDRE